MHLITWLRTSFFLSLFILVLNGCTAYVTPGHSNWVPGHYNRFGGWMPGHYVGEPIGPQVGGVWVPGHFNRFGGWVPGHWR